MVNTTRGLGIPAKYSGYRPQRKADFNSLLRQLSNWALKGKWASRKGRVSVIPESVGKKQAC